MHVFYDSNGKYLFAENFQQRLEIGDKLKLRDNYYIVVDRYFEFATKIWHTKIDEIEKNEG